MSYSYDENDSVNLDLSSKWFKKVTLPELSETHLKPVRDSYLEIDKDKVNDLKTLCDNFLVPSIQHSYYQSLHYLLFPLRQLIAFGSST